MCIVISFECDCVWLYLVKKLNECCVGKFFVDNLVIRIIMVYYMKG